MKHAFSLVELSIVLVIIGLVTGGILTGQNLIRAANLKTIATDKERFIQAMGVFQDQYYALPGDLPHATDLWGAADGNDGVGLDCVSIDKRTLSNTSLTCNGNGDGRISTPAPLPAPGLENYEHHHLWQHLVNAGLIQGSFSGTSGPGLQHDAVIGENTPSSRLANDVGWYIYSWDILVANLHWFDANYGNTLRFGSDDSTNLHNPAITAEEAWSIDTKMDDGMPQSGKVMAPRNDWAPLCVTTDDPATAEYNVSSSGNACPLFFITDL